MTDLPLTQNFDEGLPIGRVTISDEAKKLFEAMKIGDVDMVFAPAFIIKKQEGDTILEAELISLSMIPAVRAVKK